MFALSVIFERLCFESFDIQHVSSRDRTISYRYVRRSHLTSPCAYEPSRTIVVRPHTTHPTRDDNHRRSNICFEYPYLLAGAKHTTMATKSKKKHNIVIGTLPGAAGEGGDGKRWRGDGPRPFWKYIKSSGEHEFNPKRFLEHSMFQNFLYLRSNNSRTCTD